MKKVKISQANDLGRVLTLDEMKSIFGGTRASVTCTCTLTIKYKDGHGIEHIEYASAEPTGSFFTTEQCQEACNTTCGATNGCSSATSKYSFEGNLGSGGHGSGSYYY